MLLVGRIDERGVGHVVHLGYIPILVRAVLGLGGGLHLEGGPSVSMENEEIRNTLLVVRVVLQNHTARKPVLDLLDELGLKVSFEHDDSGKIDRRCTSFIIMHVERAIWWVWKILDREGSNRVRAGHVTDVTGVKTVA